MEKSIITVDNSGNEENVKVEKNQQQSSLTGLDFFQISSLLHIDNFILIRIWNL